MENIILIDGVVYNPKECDRLTKSLTIFRRFLKWFSGLSDFGQFLIWLYIDLPLTGLFVWVFTIWYSKH